MRKLSLLALVAFVSSAVFAQDAPAVQRTFRAYMDVISGTMAARDASTDVSGGVSTFNPEGKVWSGNEYEIGLVYGQNWAKVPWLTTTFAVKFGINPTWDYNADNTTTGRMNNQGPLWIRGQFGIDFTKYFSFSMDSRLLTAITTQYAWVKGAHSLVFQVGIEFYAGNYSLSGAKYKNMRQSGDANPINGLGSITRGTEASGPMIDAFWVDIVWNAKMPKGFANSLLIRPIGFGGDNPSEIAEGLLIRIQETISWSNAGFSIYARLRYNIRNIAYPTYTLASGDKRTIGIVHDLTLRAGVSYAYDFSKL